MRRHGRRSLYRPILYRVVSTGGSDAGSSSTLCLGRRRPGARPPLEADARAVGLRAGLPTTSMPSNRSGKPVCGSRTSTDRVRSSEKIENRPVRSRRGTVRGSMAGPAHYRFLPNGQAPRVPTVVGRAGDDANPTTRTRHHADGALGYLLADDFLGFGPMRLGLECVPPSICGL